MAEREKERERQRTKCIHCQQEKFYVWGGKPPYNYTELECRACGKRQGLNPAFVEMVEKQLMKCKNWSRMQSYVRVDGLQYDDEEHQYCVIVDKQLMDSAQAIQQTSGC